MNPIENLFGNPYYERDFIEHSPTWVDLFGDDFDDEDDDELYDIIDQLLLDKDPTADHIRKDNSQDDSLFDSKTILPERDTLAP